MKNRTAKSDLSRVIGFWLSVVLWTSGCGSIVGEMSDVSSISFSIKGVFKGFNYSSSLSNSTSVTQQACANYSAKLYKLAENGVKESAPIAMSSVDSFGSYAFTNIEAVKSSNSEIFKYLTIVIEGCGESYERAVTATDKQDVSAASDVVSFAYGLLTKNSRWVSAIESASLQKIDVKLHSITDKDRYQSFLFLKADSQVKNDFFKAFGFSIDELGYVAPKVSIPSFTSSVNEGATLAIDISKTHWNLDYVPEYQWLLDSSVVGTSEDLNYNLGKNSQGSRTLRLRIGKQQAVGLMDVQRPIYEKEWSLSIANLFPAIAPNLALVSSAVTNSQNVSLSINTGVANINCETFTDMIFSEDSVLAPFNWGGAFTCATSPNQTAAFTVSPGQGVKTIALWARDSAGNISVVASAAVVVLDQTPPSLVLNNLTGGQVIPGTGVFNISYTASDVNLSASPISIYASSDSGATFTQLAANLNNTGSYSWTVPTVNSSTYRIRIIAVDQAGNQTVVSSTTDFSISTSAPHITQTLVASDYTSNASSVSVTYGGGCETGVNIDISLDSSPLTSVACPAGTWSYTTTALVSDGQRVYDFSQNNGITASVSAVLKRDTAIPTISSVLVADGAAATSLRFLNLKFSAADSSGTVQSKVSHICAKTFQASAAAPSAPTTTNDACWIDLQVAGLSPSVSLVDVTLANYFFNAFVTDNHNVRAWVRDAAGNISASYAEDGLLFNLPLAGVLNNAAATNSDSAIFPPARVDLSIPAGQNVFIKWKATAGSSAFDQNSIRIFYNTTSLETSANWIEIDPGVIKSNAAGAGCTVNASYFAGCYVWSNSVGTVAMRFKVQITDSAGTISSVETNRINTGNYNVLVGDLSVGIGGTASQYTFNTTSGDQKGIAITDDGIVYTITPGVGLVRIKPTTGLVELLIPETGADVNGAIGTATMASLTGEWLQLDGQNRLYFSRAYRSIWSGDRPLRRYDPNTNTVELIINTNSAGTTRSSGTPGAQFKPGGISGSFSFSPYVAPNGDVYFADAVTNSNMVNVGFWKYTSSTGLVTSIAIPNLTSVMGYAQNGNNWVSAEDVLNSYRITGPVWIFNSDSSIKNFYLYVWKQDGSAGLVAAFDGNYQNLPQTQSKNVGAYLRSLLAGRNGKLYRTNASWGVAQVSETSPTDGPVDLLTWSGAIQADGTLASTSKSAGNYEITTNGRLYFIQSGQIRFIDENGLLRTYMGKDIYGGDGVFSRNVRILGASDIQKSNSGFIFAAFSNQIFEHRFIDDQIILRAGTGRTMITNPTLNAKVTGFSIAPSGGRVLPYIAYDPAADSIFAKSDISSIVGASGGRSGVLQISSTGSIDSIVGAVVESSASAYPVVAEGTLGVNLTSSGQLDGASLDVTPVAFDTDTRKLLMAFKSQVNVPLESRNSMLKNYDTADAKVYSYAGINSGSSAPYSLGLNVTDFDADGAVLSTSGVPTYSNNFTSPVYDGANPSGNGGPRFIVSVTNTGRLLGLPTDNTKIIQPIANVGANNKFLTYVRKSGGSFVYRCSSSGVLQKSQIVTESSAAITFTTLALPAGVTCETLEVTNSRSMYFDLARDSIIFPVKQNGFYGIAEYYDP